MSHGPHLRFAWAQVPLACWWHFCSLRWSRDLLQRLPWWSTAYPLSVVFATQYFRIMSIRHREISWNMTYFKLDLSSDTIWRCQISQNPRGRIIRSVEAGLDKAWHFRHWRNLTTALSNSHNATWTGQNIYNRTVRPNWIKGSIEHLWSHPRKIKLGPAEGLSQTLTSEDPERLSDSKWFEGWQQHDSHDSDLAQLWLNHCHLGFGDVWMFGDVWRRLCDWS